MKNRERNSFSKKEYTCRDGNIQDIPPNDPVSENNAGTKHLRPKRSIIFKILTSLSYQTSSCNPCTYSIVFCLFLLILNVTIKKQLNMSLELPICSV